MSDVREITRNILDILGSRAVTQGDLGLPVTHLTAPIAQGDTTIHFTPIDNPAGDSRLVEGSRLWLLDGAGERVVTLGAVAPDGASAKIRTSAFTGFTGFKEDHFSGTPVIGHLFGNMPWEPSAMLNLGDPAFFVAPTARGDDAWVQGGEDVVTYDYHVQTYLRLSVPYAAIEPEDWVETIETNTEAWTERIVESLAPHSMLETDFSDGLAIQFGRLGSGRHFNTTWGQAPAKRNGDVWAFVGIVQFSIVVDGQ